MGTGCYYTQQVDIEGNREKVFWYELPQGDNDDLHDFISKDAIEDIAAALEGSTWGRLAPEYHHRYGYFENNSYYLKIESTYYGDGLAIRITPKDEDDTLAWVNLTTTYYWLGERLKKHGCPLRIATSGYTSAEY